MPETATTIEPAADWPSVMNSMFSRPALEALPREGWYLQSLSWGILKAIFFALALASRRTDCSSRRTRSLRCTLSTKTSAVSGYL